MAGGVTKFVGLANYEYMFGSRLFRQVMQNNLVYSLGSVIPAIILGLVFAILLNKRLKLRGAFRFSIFYPTMIPIAAASMVWIFLFSQSYGLLNKVLSLLGLSSNIDWLNTTPYAMLSIILVSVWKFAGYYMLLFLSGLQSIDESLYEAAVLEGANAWQKFRKITLPLLSPTTFFVTLMAIINSFQSVDQVYVMTRRTLQHHQRLTLLHLPERFRLLGHRDRQQRVGGSLLDPAGFHLHLLLWTATLRPLREVIV